MNPYRMFDSIYGLDVVSKYEGRILGTLPPHIFAMGAAAYNRLVTKNGENQVLIDALRINIFLRLSLIILQSINNI